MEPLHAFTAAEVATATDECSHHHHIHGCCVVGGALSPHCCSKLSKLVDDVLSQAQSGADSALGIEDKDALEANLFGNVRCRHQRYDIKLPLEPAVREAIEELTASVGPLLEQLVTLEGRLVELSCIVSDAGAERQPLHPDTPCSSTPAAPLLTVFASLQHTSLAMGPTILCPGTHSSACHEELETIRLEDRSLEQSIDSFGGKRVVCDAGTAVVMDSRLLHCGDANIGGRRRLFYTTWLLPGSSPCGSTYSIREEIRNQFRLKHFVREFAS